MNDESMKALTKGMTTSYSVITELCCRQNSNTGIKNPITRSRSLFLRQTLLTIQEVMPRGQFYCELPILSKNP
jgi:hypothetical protein